MYLLLFKRLLLLMIAVIIIIIIIMLITIIIVIFSIIITLILFLILILLIIRGARQEGKNKHASVDLQKRKKLLDDHEDHDHDDHGDHDRQDHHDDDHDKQETTKKPPANHQTTRRRQTSAFSRVMARFRCKATRLRASTRAIQTHDSNAFPRYWRDSGGFGSAARTSSTALVLPPINLAGRATCLLQVWCLMMQDFRDQNVAHVL